MKQNIKFFTIVISLLLYPHLSLPDFVIKMILLFTLNPVTFNSYAEPAISIFPTDEIKKLPVPDRLETDANV